MHTLIRDREISKHDFVFYSDRLIRLVLSTTQSSNASLIVPVKLNNLNIIDFVPFDSQVVEHGLGHLPFTEKQVVTPTGELRK